MNPLFIIFFEDGTFFKGGNYIDTKWMKIPRNKKIKMMYHRLPTGDHLMLTGYDSYFHMCEATKDIYGGSGKRQLEYGYIMGRIHDIDKVRVFKINLLNKIGSIEVLEYNENDNYIQKLNPEIWT